MKISIIGTGYVGLCTGVGFAVRGHDVTCVDIDKEKIDSINAGKSPIYEPGLDESLARVLKEGRLRATTNTKEAIMNSDVTFISVGTPSKEDGSIDLKYIEQASRDIGAALKDKDWHIVVVKSTVVPGTSENVVGKGLEGAADEYLSMEKLFDAVYSCNHPDFVNIESIDRVDFRPGKSVYKVRSNTNHAEIQVCAVSGKILNTAVRRSDFLEDLHDGSFFGEWMHGKVLPVVAVSNIILAISGLYLWLGPKFRRKKKTQKA